MTNDITIRYATDADYDALLPMLDQAFGFPSERTNGFEELLPKLYHPEMTQLLAVKNGEIAGAVGLFERKINVCGEILTTVGIGNVACRSDLRGEGIMSALMRKATADIIASGADLSDLGGRRHRYAHFGYECAVHKLPEKGEVAVGVINRKLEYGAYIKIDAEKFPSFNTWRMSGEQDYVFAVEPGTNAPMGRIAAREKGELIVLKALEEKEYGFELGIIPDAESAEAFIAEIKKMKE